jgi:recombination protein RecA
MQRGNKESLSKQMVRRSKTPTVKETNEYDGNFGSVISTGSTLLDLSISGGRKKGGGLPGGVLVEIFGPSGSGKTVLLCEIAGAIQRQNGGVLFHDPEARLNKQFATLFDLNTDDIDYSNPDTVPEVFNSVRSWTPKNDKAINGIFTDSLAALSTNMEMENKEGDKMGMRRAKEFSEELRKTCRILAAKNQLMVCSNQVRVNVDAGPYGQKYTTPGGESIGFYASVRLRFMKPEKIKKEITIAGKKVRKVVGVETEIEVFKNSVWKPYRTAPVTILFDYGIDDVRQNLQFIKDHTSNTTYTVLDRKLSNSIEEAIKIIENEGLEEKLKFETIELWEEVEKQFNSNRKGKVR